MDDITNNAPQNNFFLHLILQLLKFVLRYIQQRMKREWAAYSFNYPLVSKRMCVLLFDVFNGYSLVKKQIG